MKVLLSGDVNGKWNALFKRVSAVNKSNGPFDVLLCTGRTFAEAGKAFTILHPCTHMLGTPCLIYPPSKPDR